jgi:hypothetical protein
MFKDPNISIGPDFVQYSVLILIFATGVQLVPILAVPLADKNTISLIQHVLLGGDKAGDEH